MLADKGVVRGEAVHIEVVGDLSCEKTLFVRFKSGKTTIKEESVQWPTDFVPMSDDRAKIILPGINDLDRVESVDVATDAGSLPRGDHWHLYNLYASSQKAFEDSYFRIKRRVKDVYTLRFAMGQILKSYNLNEAHRCVAAVVFGYRSLETADPALMRDAVEKLRQQIGRANLAEDTSHPRTDRSHLTISLGITLWHLYLALGEYENLVSQLDETISFSKTIVSPLSVTSYNTCRTILFRGYLAAKAGEVEKATDLFNYNFDFYVSSYNGIERNAIWFTELADAHRAVALSLQMNQKISESRKLFSEADVFPVINRIPRGACVDLLLGNFYSSVKWYKKVRLAAE